MGSLLLGTVTNRGSQADNSGLVLLLASLSNGVVHSFKIAAVTVS